MKKLESLDIFREKLPLWKEYGEYRSYYKKNNRTSLLHPVMSDSASNREPVQCIGVCEAEMLAGSHMRAENTDLFSVEFVEKGSLYVRRDESGWLLEEGELFLIRPGGVSEFKTGPGGFCHKLSLPISGAGVADFLRFYSLQEQDICLNVNPETIRSLIRDFSELIQFSGVENHMRNSALVLKLFQELHYGRVFSEVPNYLKSLILSFESHPESPFPLSAMAAHCHCSVTHLNRLFQSHYHSSPHRKLTEIRMNHAAALLVHTPLSIKEVADRSGYPNALNFSTEFRKQFGVSPRDYRNRREIN